MGAEGVAERFQLGHQSLETEDFAVEYDDDRTVLVEQRLLAGGQVDDGQTPMPQSHAWLLVLAAFVGAAMELGFVHAMQQFAGKLVHAAGIENAGNAAHASCLSLSIYRVVRRPLSAAHPASGRTPRHTPRPSPECCSAARPAAGRCRPAARCVTALPDRRDNPARLVPYSLRRRPAPAVR